MHEAPSVIPRSPEPHQGVGQSQLSEGWRQASSLCLLSVRSHEQTVFRETGTMCLKDKIKKDQVNTASYHHGHASRCYPVSTTRLKITMSNCIDAALGLGLRTGTKVRRGSRLLPQGHPGARPLGQVFDSFHICDCVQVPMWIWIPLHQYACGSQKSNLKYHSSDDIHLGF